MNPIYHNTGVPPYSQPYADYLSIPTHGSAHEHGPLHPRPYADPIGASQTTGPDAISTMSARPDEAKPALESHILQAASDHSGSDSLSRTHLLSERNDIYLDWAIKILGVAAAVTFGIWAPISYKITADGNSGNDKAQASLMSEISSMRAEAATAASAQRSAVTALSKVQDQLDNMGLLRAWEFCDGRTAAVCRSLQASPSKFTEALSSLGGMRSGDTSPTATSAIPSPSSPGSSNKGSSGGSALGGAALVAVVLGSVFGGIVILGVIVGLLAKRRRVRKNVMVSST